MTAEPRRSGHPMLATLLTVSLSGLAQAESSAADPTNVTDSAPHIDAMELIKEEESVSIASRYEQPISQAPSNVYVITDEDIRHSGATDIPAILRRIPGMEVMQMSGADFNVSMRGNNQPLANKLLVMVDGRSIYLDVQGSLFWKAIPVTLPEIKRIEVLKGPASAVYGFNAFDGVINIITKSAQEMKGTTLQFGAGELGTISSAAIHAGTLKNLGYRFSIGRDQNQQWRNRDALAFRSHKINGQLDYAFSDQSTLTVSGGLTDANRFDGLIGEIQSQSIAPSLGYASAVYERSALVIRAFWNRYSDDVLNSVTPGLGNLIRVVDSSGSSKNPFSANTYNLDAQHSLDAAWGHHLTYGANYRHNTLSSSAVNEFSREHRLGLYLQDTWKATSTFTVTAGARLDLQTEINATISPRVALLYTPIPDHTFRTAFSIAYRPPTLFETHESLRALTTLPPPIPTSSISVIGSTTLNPEQIVSYEAGYQGWYFKHRLRARADLFFNHLSNLVGNRNTSSTTATFVNDSGHADIYGGEAGLEFLAASWLTGFGNMSYQEIDQSLTGTVRRGAPRFKWNAGLRGEWDNGLSCEIGYHYVGSATYPIASTFTSLAPFGVTTPPERVGSYSLLNLRAGYKFWQQKAAAGYLRDAEVALSVFNALNDTHKEHPLGDMIGSRVMGWLTVRF